MCVSSTGRATKKNRGWMSGQSIRQLSLSLSAVFLSSPPFQFRFESKLSTKQGSDDTAELWLSSALFIHFWKVKVRRRRRLLAHAILPLQICAFLAKLEKVKVNFNWTLAERSMSNEVNAFFETFILFHISFPSGPALPAKPSHLISYPFNLTILSPNPANGS